MDEPSRSQKEIKHSRFYKIRFKFLIHYLLRANSGGSRQHGARLVSQVEIEAAAPQVHLSQNNNNRQYSVGLMSQVKIGIAAQPVH